MGIESVAGASAAPVTQTIKTAAAANNISISSTTREIAGEQGTVTPAIQSMKANNTNSSSNANNKSTEESGKDSGKNLKDATPEEIQSAVDTMNSKIRPHYTGCEFTFHKETNRISIAVIDKNTNKVIREIPPEKILDMVAKAWEMAGILVDEKR